MEQHLLSGTDSCFLEAPNGDDQQPVVVERNPGTSSSTEELLARMRSYRTIGLCLLSTACTLVTVLIIGSVMYQLDLHRVPMLFQNGETASFTVGASKRSLNGSVGTWTRKPTTFHAPSPHSFFNAARNLTEPQRLGRTVDSSSAASPPQKSFWPSMTLGEMFDRVLKTKLSL